MHVMRLRHVDPDAPRIPVFSFRFSPLHHMYAAHTVRGTAIEPTPYTEVRLGDGLSNEKGTCVFSLGCALVVTWALLQC